VADGNELRVPWEMSDYQFVMNGSALRRNRDETVTGSSYEENVKAISNRPRLFNGNLFMNQLPFFSVR
jgi:hypothetical protein